MKKQTATEFSRRERQIMDIIYLRGEATVAEVRERIPDAPSYSTVRALLRVLEEKGSLKHREDGPRYVFFPTVSAGKARKSALKHVMRTFFDNSVEDVVAAVLDISSSRLSPAELDKLAEVIEKSRKEGK